MPFHCGSDGDLGAQPVPVDLATLGARDRIAVHESFRQGMWRQ
jgi:hypothetical protein